MAQKSVESGWTSWNRDSLLTNELETATLRVESDCHEWDDEICTCPKTQNTRQVFRRNMNHCSVKIGIFNVDGKINGIFLSFVNSQ